MAISELMQGFLRQKLEWVEEQQSQFPATDCADVAQQVVSEQDRIAAEQESLAKQSILSVERILEKVQSDWRRQQQRRELLEDPKVYESHMHLLLCLADKTLAYQNRKFVVDDNNRDVLRFMLYYFNDCPLAEKVFPDRGYKLHKHIMLQGAVGCGKTLLMEVFSEYLRYTRNPNFFHNLSVTQMVNYYTLHNNLDRYTFNEEDNKGFQCRPVHICLNDIGVQTTTFYGMDTTTLVNEFLHARNEVWTQMHMKAHLTTNLTDQQLREKFKDSFGRLVDRFKTYNVIPLSGASRR